MFYGRTSGGDSGKGGPQKRNDRYDQMTKQQELIEQKKREIQARLEAERKRKELELTLKKSGASKSNGRGVSSSASSSTNKSHSEDSVDRKNSTPVEDKKPVLNNMFSNDGSFMEQFRRMQEQKKKEEEEAKKAVKVKEEPLEDVDEYGNPLAAKPPILQKPTIRFLDVPARSSSPAQDSNSSESRNSMTALPPPVYNQYSPNSSAKREDSPPRHEEKYFPRGGYQHVPPPPPPPPPPPSQGHAHSGGFPSQVVRQLAKDVAEGGDHIEDMARVENQDDPLMWFLYRPDSGEYKRYRDLVSQLRVDFQKGVVPQHHSTEPKRKNDTSSSDDEYGGKRNENEYGGRPTRTKKRRSRWGPESDSNSTSAPESGGPPMFGSSVQGQGISFKTESSSGFPGFPPSGPLFNNPIPGGVEAPGMGGIFPPGVAPPGIIPHGVPPPGMGIRPNIPPASIGIGFPPNQFMATPPPPPPPPGGPSPWGVKEENGGGPSAMPPWTVKEENTGVPKLSLPPGVPPPGFLEFPPVPAPATSTEGVIGLSKVSRQNPQLLAYAQQAYGTTDLDEEQWKQCEEAYKLKLVYQDIAKKKAKDEKLAAAGKFKHEYDSDEEVDGGTWEHRQRMKEMEKTKEWATDLTCKAKGKHHIGDFLPPDELAKFMDKYKSVKEGKPFDSSDYQEAKISESNVGFKMLQKMGWTDGQGLGSTGQGITAPIDKGNAVSDKQGLGVEKPGDLSQEDDEYTAYRKRMMLAYRFRPNPLNNPRRAYY